MTAPITRWGRRQSVVDAVADRVSVTGRRHTLPVAATPHGVRAALLQVRKLLCGDGVNRSDRGTCETVLAEVMNNIVEHAYADRDDGRIDLVLVHDGFGLRVEVLDEGAPMPGGCLPEPRPAALDGPLCDLPEGGFGWFVIRDLTTGLDYQRSDPVNRLRFRIPFGL